eukprot:scaffold1739_cov109-Cylindrotheca_fusiformis.AAC.4
MKSKISNGRTLFVCSGLVRHITLAADRSCMELYRSNGLVSYTRTYSKLKFDLESSMRGVLVESPRPAKKARLDVAGCGDSNDLNNNEDDNGNANQEQEDNNDKTVDFRLKNGGEEICEKVEEECPAGEISGDENKGDSNQSHTTGKVDSMERYKEGNKRSCSSSSSPQWAHQKMKLKKKKREETHLSSISLIEMAAPPFDHSKLKSSSKGEALDS